MNIADTIKNARHQGAHRTFGAAKMFKEPVKRTDPSTLVICDDPLPSHRAVYGNKYAPIFKTMKLGQAIKCTPSEVGPIALALRKFVEVNKLKAKIASTKDYGDGRGRVWMLAVEPAPVVKALKSVRG